MADIKELLDGYDPETGGDVAKYMSDKAKELGYKVFIDDGDKNVYVPKSRLVAEAEKVSNLRQTIKDQETTISDLEQKTGPNGEFATQIATLRTNLANAQKVMRDSAIKSQMTMKIQDSIAPIEDLIALINTDELIVGEDGSVLGLDKAITKLRESKSYLFKPEGEEPQGPGLDGQPPTGNPEQVQGNPFGINPNGPTPINTGDPGRPPRNYGFNSNFQSKPGSFGASLADMFSTGNSGK